ISGLASGMDTDAIIKQMMEAQRIPLNKLAQKKQLLEWKRDDFRTLNNKILEFRNAAFDMKLQSSYLTKKVASSAENIVSVSGAGANEGQYTIRVESLAKAAGFSTGKLGGAGGSTETLATKLGLVEGSYSLSIGESGKEEKVSFSSTDTLESMIKTINDKTKSTGVRATYDAALDRIFFSSAKTGEAATIDLRLVNDDTDGEVDLSVAFNMPDPNATPDSAVDPSAGLVTGINNNPANTNVISIKGSDAIVHFNGVKASYASNTFSVAGLTITAKQASSEIVDIGVTHDVDAAFDKIKGFIDKYNSLIEE